MNPLHIQSRCFSNCCFWAAFPLKENLSYLQLLGALGREPHFFSRVWGACVSAAGPRGVLPDPGYRSLPPLGDLQNLDSTPPACAGDAGDGVSLRPWGHPPPCPRGPPARAGVQASCFRSFPAGTVLCGAGDWESPCEEASSRSPCTTSLNHPSKLKFHISYACLFRLCKTERKINISFKAYWINKHVV